MQRSAISATEESTHDTGLEAMQSLQHSQALRGIQHAQESATTRESIVSKGDDRAKEDQPASDDSQPQDDVDMGFGFAEVPGRSLKRKSAALLDGKGEESADTDARVAQARRGLLPRPSLQLGGMQVQPVDVRQQPPAAGATPALATAAAVPEDKNQKKHKDLQKATELFEKIKTNFSAEKLWNSPPRSRPGADYDMTHD